MVQNSCRKECYKCDQQEEKASKRLKSSNLPQRSRENLWSRIIPPFAHFKNTKKLLQSVYKTQLMNIPQKVECILRQILEWNCNRDGKELEKIDKQFLKWLQKYVAEVNRVQSVNSKVGERAHQPQNARDDQPPEAIEKKEKPKRKTALRTLSPGIEQIVAKTPGVLKPMILRNFLNQIRGRKKQLEVAGHFTEDFISLSKQLGDVVKSYYLYGNRGVKEDGDVSFIERVSQRLGQADSATKESGFSKEKHNFTKQFNSKRNLTLKFQKRVNYDSQDKVQSSALQLSSEEHPVQFTTEKSRISRYSTESCPTKYSERKSQTKFRRHLSYDETHLKRASSSEISGTENGLQKSSHCIDKNNRPRESQSRRVVSSRKSSSSRKEDPKKNFDRNLYFHNSRYTTLDSNISTNCVRNPDSNVKNSVLNRRSSYNTQSSIDGDSFEPSGHDLDQKLHFDKPATAFPIVRQLSNSVEELPEITKGDLQQILFSASQFAEKFSCE